MDYNVTPDEHFRQQAEDHLHITYIQQDIRDLKEGQEGLNKALQDHMTEELKIKGQIEERMAKQEQISKVLVVLATAAALGSPKLIEAAMKVLVP